MLIQTRNLCKTYGADEMAVEALKSCTLTIHENEKIAIIGASGSGKSTLLHLLGGLDRPTDGSVFYQNEDIYQKSDEELSEFRRRNVGFVFQSFNLVPELTAYENVILPLILDEKQEDTAYIERIVEVLGLNDRLQHLPGELSGGQQQRVAIARAAANKPSAILCDEPTGNLDSKSSDEVIQLLTEISSTFGITLIVITHDMRVAKKMDRILTIADGVIGGDLG